MLQLAERLVGKIIRLQKLLELILCRFPRYQVRTVLVVVHVIDVDDVFLIFQDLEGVCRVECRDRDELTAVLCRLVTDAVVDVYFSVRDAVLDVGRFSLALCWFSTLAEKVESEVCGPSSFSTRALTLYAPHAYTSGSEIQLSPLKFRES